VNSNERQLTPAIFQVNVGTSEPIYRQLMEQLRRQIAGGQLQAADALPSVREVAANLGVNPMTVSKAYNMLEAEGLLERRRGVGMVIAINAARIGNHQDRLDLIKPALQRLAAEAHQLELEPAQVIALLSQLLSQLSSQPHDDPSNE
jgi:GntR family transcriptional regulator